MPTFAYNHYCIRRINLYIQSGWNQIFFLYIFFFPITGQSYTHSNNKIINTKINTKIINQTSESSTHTQEKKLYLVNNDCPVVVSLTEVWQTASLKLNPATKPAKKERDEEKKIERKSRSTPKPTTTRGKKNPKSEKDRNIRRLRNIARSFKLIFLSYQCSPIILFRLGLEFVEKKTVRKKSLAR